MLFQRFPEPKHVSWCNFRICQSFEIIEQLIIQESHFLFGILVPKHRQFGQSREDGDTTPQVWWNTRNVAKRVYFIVDGYSLSANKHLFPLIDDPREEVNRALC